MRVLIVEDEPYMAEAIRDGLRLEAIAADIAGDGDTDPASPDPTGRRSCWFAVGHAAISGGVALPARM